MKKLLLYHVLLLGSVFAARSQAVSHSVCANDPRVKRYFVNNPEPGINYTWNLSGGGTVLPSGTDTLYVNWGTVPGIYTVSVFGSLGGNCPSDTVEYLVEVLPAPTLSIQGNSNVCEGEKVTLTATGATQIVWSDNTLGPTADFYPTGPTTVWALGLAGTCPSDTAFFTMTPIPLPVAGFTANPTQGEAPLLVTFNNASLNGNAYYWDFGNGNNSVAESPAVVYSAPGSYPVTLVTQNLAGCDDTLHFEFIVVNEAFSWYVPNSFTPTGDYRNEIFRPYFRDFVEYSLAIFDRWGNTVYQSTGIDGAWNGKTIAHKDAEQGVYAYRIRFRSPNDQKEQVKTGSVTLVR